MVEPRDDNALRSAVDPADLYDAIATVVADHAYADAAEAIASDMRQLPPTDETLAVLAAVA